MAATSLVQTRARVVAALVARVEGLDAQSAASLLAVARAREVRPVKELEVFLRHPDAAGQAIGDFPLAWVRLAHCLHAAGFPVVLPVCADCGVLTKELRRSPKGRVCPGCAPPREPRACARCGRTALIMARRPEGGICNRCYLRDPAVLVACVRCTKLRAPAGRDEQGSPVLCSLLGTASAHLHPLRHGGSDQDQRPGRAGVSDLLCASAPTSPDLFQMRRAHSDQPSRQRSGLHGRGDLLPLLSTAHHRDLVRSLWPAASVLPTAQRHAVVLGVPPAAAADLLPLSP